MKINSGRVKTQIVYIFFKIYDKRRSLMNFTKEEKIVMLKARIAKMEQNPINLLKSPGVLNRLKNNLKRLEAET